MTAEITKEMVQNDFSKLKDYAIKSYFKEEYSQSLCAIETASKLMYTFNIVYTDDDLEKLLSNIAVKILSGEQKRCTKSKDKRIIFYDYFAIDNRGLTRQYIKALIDLEYEILFITYDDSNMNKTKRIFSELNQYGKARIYIVKNKDFIKAAKELYDIINDFGASKALVHTAPWDVVGVLTWSYFSEVRRYLVNLTDHAFWLGKCCSDYILEFRSYGYNISRKYRNISKDKLILLPYYPIQEKEIPFEGFPFDVRKKKVIFSGGSLYKVYGSRIFFDTIKYIIQNHDDVIVLYAGSGNDKPFKDFIETNNLYGKVYLIKERKDITHIFERCHFYLGTYPIGGGLMTQYAVANKKVPVAYSDPILKCNFIEPLFININNITLTHTNLKDYYTTIDNLLDDPDYKSKLENKLDKLLISPQEFAKNLLSSLQCKATKYPFEEYDIDINEFSKLYFQTENDYLHNYYLLFIRSRNIKLLLNFKRNLFFGIWHVIRKYIGK
jgi:hypothetical protein